MILTVPDSPTLHYIGKSMILIVPGSLRPSSYYEEVNDFNCPGLRPTRHYIIRKSMVLIVPGPPTPHYIRKSMILIVPGSLPSLECLEIDPEASRATFGCGKLAGCGKLSHRRFKDTLLTSRSRSGIARCRSMRGVCNILSSVTLPWRSSEGRSMSLNARNLQYIINISSSWGELRGSLDVAQCVEFTI